MENGLDEMHDLTSEKHVEGSTDNETEGITFGSGPSLMRVE